ncbi:MAG: methyltransferase family protein [Aureliella sp.]
MYARKLVALYFVGQALAILLWWIVIFLSNSIAATFQPTDWPLEVLFAFAIPDLLMLGGGSAVAAYSVYLGMESAKAIVWGLALLVWYPTLYCIATSVWTQEAWLASALMTIMSGLTLSMATIVGLPGQQLAAFREVNYHPRKAVFATAMQTVLFWGTFLWIIPLAIRETECNLTVPALKHAGQSYFAISLFAMASIIGLWSGWSMSRYGNGTPLPTATASRLVIAGPYRYVRNPMAIAGIVQGIAVGWYLGSFAVIGYALCGIPAWHMLVRPSEESDLHTRFGCAYANYRSTVPLWIPCGLFIANRTTSNS